MNAVTFHTQTPDVSRRGRWVALAALATAAWGLSAGVAQARGNDVYWSVGVNSPGVSVGVSNAPPVVVHPRPVLVQPAPVVVAQPYAPVYAYPAPYPYARPVVVQPRPVVYQGWGWGPRWDDRFERRHERRHDRWDDRDEHRGGHR